MLFAAVHESACGTTRTFRNVRYLVAIGVKTDIARASLSKPDVGLPFKQIEPSNK
jgi:hypothetical protein